MDAYIEIGIGIQSVSHGNHAQHGLAFPVLNPAVFIFVFGFIVVLQVKGVRHDGATHPMSQLEKLVFAQVGNPGRIKDRRVLLDDGEDLGA